MNENPELQEAISDPYNVTVLEPDDPRGVSHQVSHNDVLSALLSDEIDAEVEIIATLAGVSRVWREDRERVLVDGCFETDDLEELLLSFWLSTGARLGVL